MQHYVRDWWHSFMRMLHAIIMEQHVSAYGFCRCLKYAIIMRPSHTLVSSWNSFSLKILKLSLFWQQLKRISLRWHDMLILIWINLDEVMHRSVWRAALLEQPFADFVPQHFVQLERVKCHELLSTRVCQNTRQETAKASVSDKLFKMWVLSTRC